MAKTLRVRTRAGWVTKPAADEPENRLTAEEVDDNFLSLEDSKQEKLSLIASTDETPMADFPGVAHTLHVDQPTMIGYSTRSLGEQLNSDPEMSYGPGDKTAALAISPNIVGPGENIIRELPLRAELQCVDIGEQMEYFIYASVAVYSFNGEGQVDITAMGGTVKVNASTVEVQGELQLIDQPLGVDQGGTGARTAEDARTNLDVFSKQEVMDLINGQ